MPEPVCNTNRRGTREIHSGTGTVGRATLSGSGCNSGKDETLAQKQRESTENQSVDGKSTEDAQRGKAMTVLWHIHSGKAKKHGNYQHRHDRVQNKKVSTQANEA